MITFDFTQSYPAMTSFLFIVTGILLLAVDAKDYQKRQMNRETKWARAFGWTNVSLGILLFIAGLVYTQWIW